MVLDYIAVHTNLTVALWYVCNFQPIEKFNFGDQKSNLILKKKKKK